MALHAGLEAGLVAPVDVAERQPPAALREIPRPAGKRQTYPRHARTKRPLADGSSRSGWPAGPAIRSGALMRPASTR
jgi:hypothetical protein